MLEITNVSKLIEKKQILHDINLKVEKGHIFGLIGENGAGKTSLIKCLSGVYKVDNGKIQIQGQDVFENPSIKQKVGYVADENHYFPFYKVKELAQFYKETYNTFSMERFNELNKDFEIPLEKRIRELSKGMKMRVSLLLNLSFFPEILVLDEPTSGLDPIMKKKLLKILIEDVAERDTTIFISSHHLNDLERICDSVAFISKGEIQFIGEIETMKQNIKKLQVVFNGDMPKALNNLEEVLTIENIGRVYYVVTKKYSKVFEEKLLDLGAMFVEEIDLSLEDMFIYSMGEGKNCEKFVQ